VLPEAEAESRTITGHGWVEPVILENGARANEEVQLSAARHRRRGRARSEVAPGPLRRRRRGALGTFTLGQVGKKPDPAGLPDGRFVMHQFAAWLAKSLGWEEKMRLSLDPRDLPYLLAFRDRDQIPEAARRPYAMLILEGLLDPFPDNTLRPDQVPSAAASSSTPSTRARLLQRSRPQPATYAAATEQGHPRREGDAQTLALHPDVVLFRSFRNVSYPAKSVPSPWAIACSTTWRPTGGSTT